MTDETNNQNNNQENQPEENQNPLKIIHINEAKPAIDVDEAFNKAYLDNVVAAEASLHSAIMDAIEMHEGMVTYSQVVGMLGIIQTRVSMIASGE
jgi:hypothetical protein